jgi:DNA polymerase I-like protein with 3'-5' exonuclease and polymerase domains
LTPECCIKAFPTALERCYGSLEYVPKAYSLPIRATAVTTAAGMAVTPVLIPAERRGVEMASDTLRRLKAALKQCAEQADRQVNGWELNGRSPGK